MTKKMKEYEQEEWRSILENHPDLVAIAPFDKFSIGKDQFEIKMYCLYKRNWAEETEESCCYYALNVNDNPRVRCFKESAYIYREAMKFHEKKMSISDDLKKMLKVLSGLHKTETGVHQKDDVFRANSSDINKFECWDAYTQERFLNGLKDLQMLSWKWGATQPDQTFPDRWAQISDEGWSFIDDHNFLGAPA